MPDPLATTIAHSAIRQAVRQAETISSAAPAAHRGLPEATLLATERLVTQDRALVSWRVWGAFWSGLTAVLLVPEVQSLCVALVGQAVPERWLPVATAVLGAVWPLISKARDGRPVRQ